MKWEQFKYQGLREASIRTSLAKITSRITLSAPFQLPLYWVVVLRHAEYSRDPVLQGLFGLLVINVLVRLVWFKMSARVLATPNGPLWFRAVFGTVMVFIGTIWGVSSAYVLFKDGLDVQTIIVTIAMFGSVATMSGFSFDLPLTLLGQLIMLCLPTITLLCLDGELRILGFIVLLYAIYMVLLTLSFHRVQMSNLKSLEEIEDQEAKLREANKNLQSQHDLTSAMLNNINQAFLIFDESGFCSSIASHRSSELLGLNPRGLGICDVLRIPDAQRDSILNWYRLLFLNRLPFNEVAERGPKQLVLDEGRRVLKLEFHPIFSDSWSLSSVVFTATDVSAEVGAAEKFERQRELAGMILAINKNRNGFHEFLRDFDEYLAKTIREIEVEPNSKSLASVQQAVHNFKGLAFLFRAAAVGKMIHSFELKFRKTEFPGGSTLPPEFISELRKLRSSFIDWRALETPLFAQLGVFDDGIVEINASRIETLTKEFQSDPERLSVYERIREALFSIDVADRISVFRAHIAEIANRTGKLVEFKVKNVGDKIEVPFQLHRDVFRSLVHLFNNAVDHGIEAPHERAKRGKLPTGQIEVLVERRTQDNRSWLKLLIEDDGGGIRLQSNREPVQGSDRALSIHDLSEFIFTNGQSTKSEVSEISGLGFGMSAVRAAVIKAGGSLELLSSSPKGTIFEILLPI